MTDDKKKALQVYALGVFTVLLCVGAAWAHVSNRDCTAKGGDWSWFTCSK
jgi:hypothetical protein